MVMLLSSGARNQELLRSLPTDYAEKFDSDLERMHWLQICPTLILPPS